MGGVFLYYNKVEISGVNTAKLKVLKESEKTELLKKMRDGDPTAREKLINGNLRLVLSVIQRFSGRGENPDDLFQVGCIGLMKAIDNLIGKKVIVRSYGAGVFFGTLNDVEKCEDKWTVELINSRRIWYWEGACSITQLAVDGKKNPSGCKFTVIEPSVIVSGVVELHECSETAVKSIESVQEWKK